MRNLSKLRFSPAPTGNDQQIIYVETIPQPDRICQKFDVEGHCPCANGHHAGELSTQVDQSCHISAARLTPKTENGPRHVARGRLRIAAGGTAREVQTGPSNPTLLDQATTRSPMNA